LAIGLWLLAVNGGNGNLIVPIWVLCLHKGSETGYLRQGKYTMNISV